MKTPTLEEVIRQHIRLNPRPNSRGFFSVLCKVCNDHGKKGDRAGFKFEDKSVGYNCFNCGHHAGFDPFKHETMPVEMVKVLDAFGIASVDWEPVLYTALVEGRDQERKTRAEEFKSIEPGELALSPDFYRLTDDPKDEWAQYSIEYLSGRGIEWDSYPFYCVRKSNHPDNKKWYGRLIIPVFKGDKVVFWQGRDLTDTMVKKYLSPNVPKESVLSGYDQIAKYSDEPLYITEGWFDSYHLQGVAVFGNKLTPEQIKWINQSSRRKVVIPDRFGDGQLLANQAIDLGWSVSLPDIGACKDVNDAVLKYGQLYTMMTIKENTCDGFIAKSRIGIYCENDGKRGAKTNKKAYSAPR